MTTTRSRRRVLHVGMNSHLVGSLSAVLPIRKFRARVTTEESPGAGKSLEEATGVEPVMEVLQSSAGHEHQ